MYKWIRHNQGTFAAIIICITLLVWTYGCQSKVTSPISQKKVTRPELKLEASIEVTRLENEIANLQRRTELQFESLDRMDAIKKRLYDFASLTADNNAFNPSGVITLVGTLLGLGLGVDNRIKDKIIKNRPNPNKESV